VLTVPYVLPTSNVAVTSATATIDLSNGSVFYFDYATVGATATSNIVVNVGGRRAANSNNFSFSIITNNANGYFLSSTSICDSYYGTGPTGPTPLQWSSGVLPTNLSTVGTDILTVFHSTTGTGGGSYYTFLAGTAFSSFI
jgi:hypothetical protein